MSPGIGLSVRVTFADQVAGKAVRHKILAALAYARAAGVPLCQGDLGVVYGRLTQSWVVDRAAVLKGVNATGALLLALQPLCSPDEDPSAVAARALGTQLAFVCGLEDGWQHESHSDFWLKADLNRKHYLAGHIAGVECLGFSTLVCDRCGSRRFRGERACPGCGR